MVELGSRRRQANRKWNNFFAILSRVADNNNQQIFRSRKLFILDCNKNSNQIYFYRLFCSASGSFIAGRVFLKRLICETLCKQISI